MLHPTKKPSTSQPIHFRHSFKMLAGELLEHFRYEADVRQNCTTHARYQRNIGCGTREETSEKWYRQEIPIGKGSFSKVWKELRQLQDGQQQIRAVKEIDKAPLRHEKVDYRKELYALINFSKAKVFMFQVNFISQCSS